MESNLMADLTNSHSLTDFQRNARAYIEDINKNASLCCLPSAVR